MRRAPIGVGGEFLSSDERRASAVILIRLCICKRQHPARSIDCLKSPVIALCSTPMGIVPIMMRKTLLAATWGSFLLFSAEHAFAEHFRRHSQSFVRLKTSRVLALRLRMDQPGT